MHRPSRSSRRTLLAVALALLLRLLVVALAAPEQQRVFNTDSYEYDRLAKNLLATGRLTPDRHPPHRPEELRPPLFPALAAALYALLGPRYAAVLAANAVLAALAALLLARAHPRYGPPAALLYALDATSVVYASFFVADTLLALLLLVSVLLLARALAGEARRPLLALAGSGLAAGAAVLAKPAATYFPAVLLLGALLARGRRERLAAVAALVLAGYAVAVAPWALRNRRALGVLSVSTSQEINFLFWFVGVMEGERSGQGQRLAEEELRRELEARTGRSLEELPVAERLRAMRRLAWEHVRAHPLLYARAHLRGSLGTLLDPGRLDTARILGGIDWGRSVLQVLSSRGVLAAAALVLASSPVVLICLLASALWLLLVHVAALLGLARDRGRLRADPLLLLALLAAAYLVAVTGTIGSARYRTPAVPFLALLAGNGLRARTEPQ